MILKNRYNIYKDYHKTGSLRYYMLGFVYLFIGLLYFLMMYVTFETEDYESKSKSNSKTLKKEWIYFSLGICYMTGMIIYVYIGYAHKHLMN